ncbi:MAG: 2-isopropylmalate synthase [Bacillota bacterium]|nr:2-isopropylmalate synthase [Bacillota bacterium]
MERRVLIFDTTLRDGEQSPGVSLTPAEKLEIARQLARLRVDVIEAGFPVASPGDFEAVTAIAREVRGPVICALARANPVDIDRAAAALAGAERKRIHTFIASSDVHMKYKLRKEPREVLEAAVAAVKRARQYTEDVEFSAEDATRSRPEFLCTLFRAAIDAGATTINVPDTVGYTTPREFAELIRFLRENVPGIDGVVISVHCHDDLGLAVANSLAAVEAGAGQVECAVNGIGERAGNASLEEVVMALKVRQDALGASPAIATEQIYRTSRLVATLTGMPVPPNKAVVGANAFAHESGIHQDGVLKERTTYEIIRPEDVGVPAGRLVLGKHSGRHAFRERLLALGYQLREEDVEKAFARFKEMADRKKDISDRDLEALVENEVLKEPEVWSLDCFQVSTGNRSLPTATVSLVKNGQVVQEAACGDGPVDALLRAVERAVGADFHLLEFSLKAVTGGKDALGEAAVRVERDGAVYSGRGVSTDVLEASVRAYLQAVNRWLSGMPVGRQVAAAGVD